MTRKLNFFSILFCGFLVGCCHAKGEQVLQQHICNHRVLGNVSFIHIRRHRKNFIGGCWWCNLSVFTSCPFLFNAFLCNCEVVCIVSSTLVNTNCTKYGKNKKSFYLHNFLARWERMNDLKTFCLFPQLFSALCPCHEYVSYCSLDYTLKSNRSNTHTLDFETRFNHFFDLCFNIQQSTLRKRQSYNIKVECKWQKKLQRSKKNDWHLAGVCTRREIIIWFNVYNDDQERLN